MFLVKKIGVVVVVLIGFLACSQERFIQLQKKAQEQENDGSKRPSYVDSDYEVFSETIFLKNMVHQPTRERDAFIQPTKDGDDSFNPETSVILLDEPSDNDTKNPPLNQNESNNNTANNDTKNPFLYKPKRKTKDPKLIEYSQQNFYPLKDGDIVMSKEGDQWLIKIKSKALKRFLKDQNDKDRQIQTFTFNDTKTQIAQFKGKISSYVYTTNNSDLSLRPFYESFLLEKKSDDFYMIGAIGDKALDAIEIQKCQMVLKKHSTDKLDSQHKAISIDLDFKKERFKSDTELFLECQS
ncbi:hypothetical protein MPF97_03070 [Helicobacter pylori]|uniref:hypothetical protein n=1 Tax=Helicobacter pylori TaxID=210 RepID=UPI001FD6D56B|nr:hypothetical protein [Helicobacter pylori]UOR74027.1 hypothetical protein MPF97_03070 [Helicobacter pylori]